MSLFQEVYLQEGQVIKGEIVTPSSEAKCLRQASAMRSAGILHT